MQHLINRLDPAALFSILKGCLPSNMSTIALHEPSFSGNEWKYVKECIDTGWVSSAGRFVDKFEGEIAQYTGVGHAIATVNGTAALHVALRLVGVDLGDEVLVPALSFIAASNAVSYCGAIPHFVDSEERTLGVDASKLRTWLDEIACIKGDQCFNKQTQRRIKALVVVHTFGHPADLESIKSVAQDFHLELIEDAAEALGSLYKGRHVGHWGKLSILSFNGNKTVTCGGGGAILTQDKKTADLAKHITSTAKLAHPWAFHHDQIGYNYRMPNINAALGCAQLEQLEGFIERKRLLAERYAEAFAATTGVHFFREPGNTRSNYWLNAIQLDREYVDQRDIILSYAQQRGVLLRPAWNLMHTLPMFRDCPKMDLSVAENLEAALINLPSSAFL